MAAGKIAFNHPGQFRFVNKGISGERSTGLYARCMFEMRESNPDYMSVLIGVNDVWHALGNGDMVRPNRYEQLLTMLVEDALEVFPNITIAILEPFVLKGPATEGQWEAFDSNVRTVAKIAKQVAERYHLVFVPLQEKFDAIGVTRHSIALEIWKLYERCTQQRPVEIWDSTKRKYVFAGLWQFDVKGALKALDMLRQLLPEMKEDADGGGESYEDMLGGGGAAREF